MRADQDPEAARSVNRTAKQAFRTVREADNYFPEVWIMSIGFVYWLLMLFWLIFGFYWNRNDIRGGNYGVMGGNLMLFVLLFLVGWKTFGFPIQA
jgi:hypothetical protein